MGCGCNKNKKTSTDIFPQNTKQRKNDMVKMKQHIANKNIQKPKTIYDKFRLDIAEGRVTGVDPRTIHERERRERLYGAKDPRVTSIGFYTKYEDIPKIN